MKRKSTKVFLFHTQDLSINGSKTRVTATLSYLSFLLALQIDVNASGHFIELSFFEYIVSKGHIGPVTLLIESGAADLDHDGGFALRYAVRYSLNNITRVLVSAGANISLSILNEHNYEVRSRLHALTVK